VTNKSYILRDPEFYFIVLYNLIIIYLFLNHEYDGRYAVWGYYLQSVFIGMQYVSISLVKIFKRDGSIFPLKKLGLIGFFILHFGLFHFVYLVFLVVMTTANNTEGITALFNFVKASMAFLLANTIFLLGRELIPAAPDYPKPSILTAYVRIIPIHLFIMLNKFSGINYKAFIVFMVLKLFADLLIYLVFNPKPVK
jgi:hypothetical protein